jgi:hypothetical protein
MLLLLIAKAKLLAVKVDTSLDRPIYLVNLSAFFLPATTAALVEVNFLPSNMP